MQYVANLGIHVVNLSAKEDRAERLSDGGARPHPLFWEYITAANKFSRLLHPVAQVPSGLNPGTSDLPGH
jgi:hypothetical protein